MTSTIISYTNVTIIGIRLTDFISQHHSILDIAYEYFTSRIHTVDENRKTEVSLAF